VARVAGNPRLRGEAGWVIANKLVNFALVFVSLKVMTSLIGKEAFGEYNLSIAALVLVTNIVIVPFNRPYRRLYHTAETRGEGRSAAVSLLKGYAVGTCAVVVAAAALTIPFSRWFGLGLWTTLAAGLVFLGNQWRLLGLDVRTIRRQRSVHTLQDLGFQLTRLGLLVAFVLFWHASAAVALLTLAIAAALFAIIGVIPFVRETIARPPGPVSSLMPMVVSFGVPTALVLICQWVQGFGDRYILRALLDFGSVGVYVAAYQVCGAPFALMTGIVDGWLRPIAYQRCKGTNAPQELWSADKVLLGGIVLYVVLGALALPVYLAWGPQLVVLLTSPEFAPTLGVVITLTLGRYIQCLTLLVQMFYAVHQKMAASLAFRIVGALLTIPICWFTTRAYGVFGAALGMLIAVGIYAILLSVGPGGCLWLVRANHRRCPQGA
jgi:O-antigen/teichoic acid export membrane protein